MLYIVKDLATSDIEKDIVNSQVLLKNYFGQDLLKIA